jgi:hypothetical protein
MKIGYSHCWQIGRLLKSGVLAFAVVMVCLIVRMLAFEASQPPSVEIRSGLIAQSNLLNHDGPNGCVLRAAADQLAALPGAEHCLSDDEVSASDDHPDQDSALSAAASSVPAYCLHSSSFSGLGPRVPEAPCTEFLRPPAA